MKPPFGMVAACALMTSCLSPHPTASNQFVAVAAKDYSIDSYSIYFKNNKIFSLPQQELGGFFKGPIFFGGKVAFVETFRNLVVVCSADRIT